MTGPALETRGLSVHFGAILAARDVNIRLEAGARHALIGPNGAGKTTLVNLITGRLRPSAGSILLDGEDVTGLTMEARVKRGLVRTFQVTTLMRGLATIDQIALAIAEREGRTAHLFRPAGASRAIFEEAYDCLERLGIAADAERVVAELPYGRQRLVEIAIGLALRPKVLLLDEPAAGVPGDESVRILDVLAALPADIAILVIEHDMALVQRFARSATVLVGGGILIEGSPDAVLADPGVKAVYLGEARA